MSFASLLNIAIIILVILIILYYLLFSKSQNFSFYQVEDKNGQKSLVHNRGDNTSNIYFLLKEEIQNGEIKRISEPIKIYVGVTPEKLNEKNIINFEENDLYYKIQI